jgi:hypothetical protein
LFYLIGNKKKTCYLVWTSLKQFLLTTQHKYLSHLVQVHVLVFYTVDTCTVALFLYILANGVNHLFWYLQTLLTTWQPWDPIWGLTNFYVAATSFYSKLFKNDMILYFIKEFRQGFGFLGREISYCVSWHWGLIFWSLWK